ncbi:mediator of RNA polymerase II transcription subunit 9 [Exaiptasia diaphana]|uniref:Mediator of RNA polymerase II transcription subunit 9 n=1 Tax=Exaiptasia diaphana TaxID=2652724 RepID=A0A913WQ32_EXADI|nr:mediator of RNA polymerase II transcription subunit 9 [Exaiptasia diaphana]KXJ18923.1 Mediator of RNA polymerase II transcription subunit 9 [Exaiptasia diaphana]
MEDQTKVDIVSEFNLLPVVFDIIHSVQKTGDTQDMAKKVNNFRAKIQHCRKLLDTLPGLDMNCEDQKAQLVKHNKEYERKSALVAKYKQLPVFSEAIAKEMIL